MKITLITVCYNSEKTIEDTIKSVLKQTYDNYEYLIIDGKSKDKTLDIANKYVSKFKGKMHIISEKDKGLYDAMNKGIKIATGDIIGLLNSDDILANPYVFAKIVKCFEKTNCDASYSDLVFKDEKLEKITRNFIAHNHSKHFGWHPPHPTLYLKKSIYKKIGNFKIEYKICADLDFMMRLIKADYKMAYIKEYLVIMRSGGVSTNGLSGYLKNFKESNNVLKTNKIHFYHIINIFRIFKTIMQALSAKIFQKRIEKRLLKENKI